MKNRILYLTTMVAVVGISLGLVASARVDDGGDWKSGRPGTRLLLSGLLASTLGDSPDDRPALTPHHDCSSPPDPHDDRGEVLQDHQARSESSKIGQSKYVLFLHDGSSAKSSITNEDWDGCSDLAGLLETMGFNVQEQYLSRIDATDLVAYDIVVFASYWENREIDFSEAEALASFVEQGGGLLLIAEYNLAWVNDELNKSANKVGDYFGLEFRDGMVCDSTDHYDYSNDPDGGVDIPFITDITSQEVTSGIEKFVIPWGSALSTRAPAVAVAYSDTDAWLDTDCTWDSEAGHWDCSKDDVEESGRFPVLATSTRGSGRVVAIADSGIIVNAWIDEYDHYGLARNIFSYLLGVPVEDVTAPARISDLQAMPGAQAGEVALEWTAPGDDGESGTASEYIVRHNTSQIDESNWDSSTDIYGEPTPSSAGTAEIMTVDGLVPGRDYYFAVKALDEVPNASGVSNSAHTAAAEGVQLELYIEDALSSPPLVNKAPGDTVDIVAQVSNRATAPVDDAVVSIVSPYPEDQLRRVFGRGSFTALNTHSVVTAVAGTVYSGTVDLGPRGALSSSEQIIWRVEIPDHEAATYCPVVDGHVEVDGTVNDSDSVTFNLTDNARALIVTNRQLLLERYGDAVSGGSSADVRTLLNHLYHVADSRNQNCVVHYVDHADDSLQQWDQNVDYTDENAANEAANRVDDLIEDWVDRTNSEYVMIVGGDEVVPHYRLDDTYYYDTAEDSKTYSDDPVLRAFDENYFLSDSPYADTAGDDYDEGEAELAVGRIVGHSASAMRQFIENRRPMTLTKAVVADSDKINKAIDALEAEATVETSETWTDDQLEDVLEDGFEVFLFDKAHGNYNELVCSGGGSIWASEIDNVDFTDGISDSKPQSYLSVCRTGVVTDEDGDHWNPEWDDCLLYALVNQGSSGVIGSGGKSISGVDVKLINPYFSKLMEDGGESMAFGEALREAKRDYRKGLFGWDGAERKTVTEFMYFGVPWSTVDLASGEARSVESQNSDVLVDLSAPSYVSENVYSRTMEITVTNYDVSEVDGYDLVEIDGATLSLDEHHPILPVIETRLSLPSGGTVIAVAQADTVSTIVGPYDIPSFVSAEEPAESGYEPSTGASFYPPSIYQTEIAASETGKELAVVFAPLAYNPRTDQAILHNYTALEITYQTPVSLVLKRFSPEKTEYSSGKTIGTSVTLENVGARSAEGLEIVLTLRDSQGRVRASATGLPFDIAPGELNTLHPAISQDLRQGTYLLEAEVEGTNLVEKASAYVYIRRGEIIDFSWPSEARSGENVSGSITFANASLGAVKATGSVRIYGPGDIQLARVSTGESDIEADSLGSLSCTWDVEGSGYGEYRASAVVHVGDEVFGPVNKTFLVRPQRVFLPITLRVR